MKADLRGAQSAPAGEADPRRPAGIRAMERADVPTIGKLFNKIFRKTDCQAGEDLRRYLETVFFGSPLYTRECGSVVHENGGGDIDSAILAVPIEFLVHGRPTVARLLCAFMADGKAGAAGAARLARMMRAERQEMCFSDSSSPVSADHWVAAGGAVLPIQSLEWRRAFRPFVAGAFLASRRVPLLRSRAVIGALALADHALRWRAPSTKPSSVLGFETRPASLEEFRQCAGPMLKRFSVRPTWSRPEFDWLAAVASLNRSLGALQCRKVICERGRTVGTFLFFGKENGIANVLNVLCEEGREFDVTAEMFASLDREGYAAAVGMAQPFLMNAISRRRWLSFRHRGYFCMVTRHADLMEAALRNDIYIGGLASESWSRLLTDF
ncbi:GNAT family N-acetyltransferase [Sinorhizobium garamanticum]|uniref:GNAT family N-acetyltransferase n=1 Tax=Sinorhizobium garamanticum TaxID=680247 RepID=A0ABY8DEZ4_9HYPH|nr:GNAT family N-acetyltransferase [Sinorhizobium garamanticum]WEX88643.1 GNAT family N-acetyltransferase [Sinorhizobium garamanticum]